ncbi:hypothetical protein AHAS_Ahas07G0118400 [Arachis hypogaea]
MVDAYVPFNAVNSAYYQPMIDVIANMHAGYKGPNFGRVRGYLLSKLVEDVKKMIEQYHEIRKRTGCTIMVDGWTDRCRRTLINFLVYCPKGTIFLKSVDASHASKTAELLFKLFKDVVNFVGPENVVHIVTDNTAKYVAIGRNLMRKQSYDPICLDTFDDHLDWILEDSPPFLTPEEVDALQNDLANMSIQPTLDDLDHLNLEDDQDNDGPSNNAMEDMDTN